MYFRMSEQNIGPIVDSFEEIYREHRRNGARYCLP